MVKEFTGAKKHILLIEVEYFYFKTIMANRISWTDFETLPEENPPLPFKKEKPTATAEMISLLKIFNFEKFYPEKISVSEALKIRNASDDNETKDLECLPWILLKKLISCDTDFRESEIYRFLNKWGVRLENEENGDNVCEEDRDSEPMNAFTDMLHPTDIFLMIFQCCDPFLKGLLMKKIALCGMALPFMFQMGHSQLTIYATSWQLREIYINEEKESIMTGRFKSVTFLKLGDFQMKSKSEVLDDLIESDLKTFFSRECDLGDNDRIISSGLVEIFWHTPKDEHDLSDGEKTHIFFNLRGDAYHFGRQVETLAQLSSLVVLFADVSEISEMEDNLKKLLDTFCKVATKILVVTNATKYDEVETCARNMTLSNDQVISIFDLKTKVSSKKKTKLLNRAAFKELIKTKVFRNTKSSRIVILEQELAKISTLIMDEKSPEFEYGKVCAEKILGMIKNKNKDEIFPLQGDDLWKKLSHLEKSKAKFGKNEKYDISENDEKEISRIRQRQAETLNDKSSKFMAIFIKTLVDNIDHKRIIMYFLNWLKNEMDKESKNKLPKLQEECDKLFNRYKQTKHKREKNEYERAKQALSNSSMGLEHIFRELSQIYESFMHCKSICTDVAHKTKTAIELLPKLVTELLFLGYPIEIMDGDAENVPGVWLNNLFKELGNTRDSMKIVTASVLGVQSSGKSTLLNTMFGLQFAVSAGRCTRGIYAQLVPVANEHFQFDYCLVLDTEGLQAPDLPDEEKNLHDNKLAMLAIGLADVAMINVKGEIISDLKDVLQMVVQGLVILKGSNALSTYYPKGIFIHQNIDKNSSRDVLRSGVQSTIIDLDNLVANAAKSQGFMDLKCINDIIDLGENDVVPIPNLWMMSHVNQNYSQAKKTLLYNLLKKSAELENCQDIQEFSSHLHLLWKGLISENLELGFRNFREMEATKLLQNKFESITWVLMKFEDIWLKENLKRNVCEDQHKMAIDSFKKAFSTEVDKIKKDLDMFIETSRYAHYMKNQKPMLMNHLEKTLQDTENSVIGQIEKQIDLDKRAQEERERKEKQAEEDRQRKMMQAEEDRQRKMKQAEEDRRRKAKQDEEDTQRKSKQAEEDRQRKADQEEEDRQRWLAETKATCLFSCWKSSILKSLKMSCLDYSERRFKVPMKRSIIKEILKELANKDDMNDLMRYIENSNSFARKWLEVVLENQCVKFVDGVISKTNDVLRKKLNYSNLLRALKNELKNVGVDITNDIVEAEKSDISDVERMSKEFLHKIDNYDKTAVALSTEDREDIIKRLWVCDKCCLWCGEPCIINTMHGEHECLQHRPRGINGIHVTNTKEMCLETCNFAVQSGASLACGVWCGCSSYKNCTIFHPYSEYKTYIGSWSIPGSTDMSSSSYWCWVVSKFGSSIAEHYGIVCPRIPDSWQNISKSKAIESLK